jgi:hypothetical protein
MQSFQETPMRSLFAFAGAIAALACFTGSASAQIKSVPIDTSAYVVKPVDTTTSILGGAARYVSRVTASAIDSNGFVKTVNNLLGKTPPPPPAPPTQAGYSPLPHPSLYPSNSYASPLQPALPKYQSR